MRSDATMPLGMKDGQIVALARPDRRRTAGPFGEYDLVMPLARGGMGGVYLAAHCVTGEKVALKVLDSHFAGHPEVVQRLDAEHELSSRANHCGLVEIREARRTEDDVPYLVMEYLDGETLGALADRGEIELPTIIAICAQVASALSALHAAGVVHCDVKHENVFVLDDHVTGGRWPRVKLIDFGVSREVGEVPLAEATIAGTPWCMAPEQWSGAPTPKSDVYALGCLLYDLTTGAAPFDGSLPELMVKHLEHRPARPSWLRAMPIALERLILRALAKAPDERPEMHELASGLLELADAHKPVELRKAG
jgi:serine/threonine protein kinase